MSPRASGAILRHEFRVMATDPSTVVFLILMPLLMVALMRQLFAGALAAQGFTGANGSEFAVPGMAVGFAAFGVAYAGFTFFRDHGWGTWDRLRAAPITSVDLIAGKLVPTVVVTILQLGLLFVLGGPLFDFRVAGSWTAIWLTIVVLSLSLSAFGMAVTAVARTMQQLNAIGSVGGFAMAMLGGAWVPVASMPGWAQAVAEASPVKHFIVIMRSVLVKGAGLGDIQVPLLVLTLYGAGVLALAVRQYSKTSAA